jgi:hypothetical protein
MEACPKMALPIFWTILEFQNFSIFFKTLFEILQNCPKNGQGHFGTRFHMLRGMHSVGDGRFLGNFGKVLKKN